MKQVKLSNSLIFHILEEKIIGQKINFILHEGPLGVFNDTLKEFSYEDIEETGEIIESTKDGWIGYTDHYWQVAIFLALRSRSKQGLNY